MTIYLGDFPTGKTIYVPFHTFNSSGASVTITGLAVTDIEIYRNGSTTQRASDAGYALLDTDGIDFDGLTGIHGFSIDTSNNTDSGFYAAGYDYWVVVSAITVDSQTVSMVAATFSIDNRQLLRPTVASRTLDVSAGGEAGVDWANVGSPTTTVSLSGTTVATVTTTTTATNLTNAPTAGDFTATMKTSIGTAVAASAVASVTGNVGGNVTGSVGSVATGGITAASIATGAIDADALATDAINEIADGVWDELQSGHVGAGSFGEIATEIADILADTADMQPKMGTPAGASVSADIAAVKAQTAAIEADTQDLQTQIGTDGAGLTNMPWSTSWDAEVQSECADAIAAAALATAAELAKVPKSDSTVTWNATALASINSQVDTAIVDASFRFGLHAEGTLSGTHSSTTADLGGAAPSTDISGFTLYIPARGFVRIIDSYNTGTGVATFETTSATLTNSDPWYLFATPSASAASPIPANIKQVNSITIDGAGTTGDPWGPA